MNESIDPSKGATLVPTPEGVFLVADAPDAPTPTSPQADPRFLDPLVLEYLNGKSWRLYRGFNYQTDVFPVSRRPIRIPVGFTTDFASVPRFFWRVLPPTGKYGKAAVIHDFLYRTPSMATKAEADSVFLEAMKALGVNMVVRQTMYQGVRWFGKRAYRGGL